MPAIAPSGGPPKTAGLRGKTAGSRGSVPFGDSNGLVCLLTPGASTATTGAWGSPTVTASACLGVHDAGHGPFRRSPKNSRFAGENGRVPGVRALWGQQWTRLPLLFSHARSTATTGAWPPPPQLPHRRHRRPLG